MPLGKATSALKTRLNRDNRKSLAGVVLLTGQRVFQKSFGLISTYFIVRALTQDEFGTYSYVISVASLMTIFGFTGFKNALMQSIARGHAGTYRKVIPLSLAGCLIGTFLMLVMAYYYKTSGDNTLSNSLLAAALLLPFYEGLSQWRQITIGKENFKSFFKLETGWQFAMHASMVAVAIFYPNNVFLAVLVFMGVPSLLNAILTIRDLRSLNPEETSERESIGYGIKTSFYAAFNTIAVQSDKLLLFMFMSPASVAVFVAAERIPELMRNMVQDGIAVMAPRFAREKTYSRKLDNALKKAALAIGLAIAAFSVLILPWLLLIIFGESYAQSIPYAQALALSVAVGNAATLRYRYIRSQLDTANFAKITISTSILRVAMSAILIPIYGISGAVASAFAYRLIMSITVDWIIRKHYLKTAE